MIMRHVGGRLALAGALLLAAAVAVIGGAALANNGGTQQAKSAAAPLSGVDVLRADDAGFSAYLRLPPADDPAERRALIDAYLFQDAATPRWRGPALPTAVGETYTIVSIGISNIDNLTTPVRLYHDTGGWVVAYFQRTSPASALLQGRQLSAETPILTSLSETTLLDALNVVITEALGLAPITGDQAGYYHWGRPDATGFVFFGTARGDIGKRFMVFAAPEGVTLLEASLTQWMAGASNNCESSDARVVSKIDGVNIGETACQRGLYHHDLPLPDASPHLVELAQSISSVGSSGHALLLVYRQASASAEVVFGDPEDPSQGLPLAVFSAVPSLEQPAVTDPAPPLSRFYLSHKGAGFGGTLLDPLAASQVTGRVTLAGRANSLGAYVGFGDSIHFAAANGSFGFDAPSGTVFDVQLAAPGYLPLVIKGLIAAPGGVIDLNELTGQNPIILWAGDLNGDGVVDAADLALAGANLERGGAVIQLP